MDLLTAKEVAALLGVGMNSAYKVIARLNAELKEKGYLVVEHRVPRKYLMERYYS